MSEALAKESHWLVVIARSEMPKSLQQVVGKPTTVRIACERFSRNP